MTTVEDENRQPSARFEQLIFKVGDRVQLTDPKGRLHTLTLDQAGAFYSHKGILRHSTIIGALEGSVHLNEAGVPYLALRPMLQDFVMSMPRGAAIIYPKDTAQILTQADIFPGAVVVEAGVGSGALSLWLLRTIGLKGRLFSFERREEFAAVARGNIAAIHGDPLENWTLTIGDLAEQLPSVVVPAGADRVVLDMLAPWENIEQVAVVLRPGGVLICYVATVTQLSRMAESIRNCEFFTEPKSSETMVRSWHVDGLAVRPDHRMIAHTGFLISARRLAPGAVLPRKVQRNSKSDYSDEDLDIWTPGAVGERELSPRLLRKRASAAQALAKSTNRNNNDHTANPIT